MSIAQRMPTTSLLSVAWSDSSVPIDPAASTWMPADDAGSVASKTVLAISSSSSAEPTSSSTGANAVCLSFESSPAVWPASLSGRGHAVDVRRGAESP